MQFIGKKSIGPDGRLVIPDIVRQAYGFHPGTSVMIYMDGALLVFDKAAESRNCCICQTSRDLAPIRGKYLCRSCKENLSEPSL